MSVAGHRLHLHCVGEGSPTVVLDAGLGAFSLDWGAVQPQIATSTRVCAYDRSGLGWSDPGRRPRSPQQFADELHTLLTNAGIPGPYVLVGHSISGKTARVFASQHPNEVADGAH
jgi:pimeloyl-ACP methyl ester carboxylesterase